MERTNGCEHKIVACGSLNHIFLLFIHSFIFHFLKKQHIIKDQENLTEVEKVVGVSKKQACQVETPIILIYLLESQIHYKQISHGTTKNYIGHRLTLTGQHTGSKEKIYTINRLVPTKN